LGFLQKEAMSTTTSATPAPTAASVEAPVSSVAPSAPAEESKKKRNVVTVKTLTDHFDEFQKLVEEQIDVLRKLAAQTTSKSNSATGIKFLRTVNRHAKQLKREALRVIDSSKKRPRRTTDGQGGFQKPLPITAEMAAFANWNPAELKSRVDVTNAICSYVRTNKLQDPAARKNIIPDDALKSLLKFNPDAPGAPALTYFHLQRLIGPACMAKKAPVVPATSAPATSS
jgi:chromatin remodeling complex protein RSC6